MPAIWLQALASNATPPVHSVFLTFNSDDDKQGATRYLVSEVGGQCLPFAVDRFDSEAEAKERCHNDLGIEPGDWQPVAEEPNFHSAVAEASEQAIQSYFDNRNLHLPKDCDDTSPQFARDDL